MRERAVSGHPDSPGRTPGATLPSVTEREDTTKESTEARPAPSGPGDDTAASLGDYRATFYAARVAMAVLNRDGLVLAANPAFGELVGTDPAELVAATATDLTDLGADPRGGPPTARCCAAAATGCAAPAASNTPKGTPSGWR